MSLVGLNTGCTNYTNLMRLEFLTSQLKYEDSRFVLYRFLVSNLALRSATLSAKFIVPLLLILNPYPANVEKWRIL